MRWMVSHTSIHAYSISQVYTFLAQFLMDRKAVLGPQEKGSPSALSQKILNSVNGLFHIYSMNQRFIWINMHILEM